MHDDDSPRRVLAPHEKDDRDQEGILGLVIAEHPIQLTVPELVRQMVPPGADWIESDDIERGVRELIGLGLCIAAATRSGRPARRSASTTCSSTATRPRTRRTDSHPSGFSEAGAQATGRMRRRSITSGFAPCLGLREAAGERLHGNVSPGVGAPPHGGLTSCPGSREGAAADPRRGGGGPFAFLLTSRRRKRRSARPRGRAGKGGSAHER